MSRIANNPITVPESVEVDVNGAQVRIKGRKGELTHTLHSLVQLDREDNLLKFSAKGKQQVGAGPGRDHQGNFTEYGHRGYRRI